MSHLRSKPILAFAALLSAILAGATIAVQTNQKQTDGVVKVDMGGVVERGKTTIEEADLTKRPPLPKGFVPLNGKAYKISNDGIVYGPFDVVFKVGSVTDEQTFKDLRVLHVEPDEFDPDSYVWVDRTGKSNSNEPGHNFLEKTITGNTRELDAGIYMIAKVVPKIEANADLEVTAKGSPESVQMPATLGLKVTIKNHGPQVATDVGVLTELPRGEVVSAKPSQGTCKDRGAALYCKLGQLVAGSSATIEVGMDPTSEFGGEFTSRIKAAAREADNNPDNNQTEGTVLVLADPNIPPEVGLYSPSGPLLEQGATVLLKAIASDSDGSITKVEFYDNEKSLGIGTPTDGQHFTLRSGPLSNGPHRFHAVATDNGGRTRASYIGPIFVNGPIQVRIVEPKVESVIAPGSDLTLVAEAAHPSGSIKTLEFFFTHNTSLGLATATQDNRFTLELRNARRGTYNIEARATDESGLVSKSAPLEFTVSTRPTVKILTPANGVSLVAPANIEISFNFEVFDSHFSTVEIYANAELIKSGPALSPGKYTFNWAGVKAGKYVLKAVVLDDIQTRGESEVNIIVNDRNGRKQ